MKGSLLANWATPQSSFTVQLQIRVEIKTLQTHFQNTGNKQHCKKIKSQTKDRNKTKFK